MLLRKRPDTGKPRVGDQVVALEQIGAIPEETRGVVKLVDGFQWIRYWVAWDTGEWMGSVDDASVVRADRYEDYKATLAQRAEIETAAPEAAAEDGAGEAAGGAVGGVPEHLLERSRQARERWAQKAAG